MILYRSLREDLQDLTGSPQKGLLLEEILQDIDTRTPPRSIPEKAFIQAPNCIHGSCKIFMQGPLRGRIFFAPRHNESDQSHERVALAISNTHRAATRAI